MKAPRGLVWVEFAFHLVYVFTNPMSLMYIVDLGLLHIIALGLNIKGLDKNNMPRSGDVMVYKKDTTLGQTKEFAAQIQVLDIPNEIKVGYSPIGFVRCGRSACRISKLTWKMGKETGGKVGTHSLRRRCHILLCDAFLATHTSCRLAKVNTEAWNRHGRMGL